MSKETLNEEINGFRQALRRFLGDVVSSAIAMVVSRPRIAQFIVDRAMRTPYRDILSPDGEQIYMRRWWLFNRYDLEGGTHWSWLPSIRVHHIMEPDHDRHLHDHPWNARTFILDGWYLEEIPGDVIRFCDAGYTGRLLFGQYHRIEAVSPGGVFTVFVAWKHRGTWGFMVDGKKIHYYDYLNGVRK